VLPSDVFSSLITTHLSVADRSRLRLSSSDLRRCVDGVRTHITIHSFMAGVGAEFWGRLKTMLQHMTSLTHVSIEGRSIITTNKLKAFLKAAGPTLQNRLQWLSLTAPDRTYRSRAASPHLLDLSPLASCPNLRGLYLIDLRACVDLTALGNLPVFRHLVLKWSPRWSLDYEDCSFVRDLSPLSRCTNLQHLALVDCRNIKDLSPLASCTQLRRLSMTGLPGLSDISPLASCNLLESVDLSGCPDITNISPLASCSMIEHLYLSDMGELCCISPLASCPRLKHLDLAYVTQLVSISSLSECKELQYLNLEGCNRISDFSAIPACTKLKHLDLTSCLYYLNALYNLNGSCLVAMSSDQVALVQVILDG
jgi:hypothetical protein